jgi:UDPglucose 6-dehydrogenase
MKVSVIGTGYVGLVSGICLAEIGHSVICVDNDLEKVALINAGKPPIYELGLDDLLKKHIGRSLHATNDLYQAVFDSEISLIAVGTPFDGSTINLSYIREVAAQIGAVLRDKAAYHVVIVKSTVVPGTTDEIVLTILEESSGKKAGRDFGVGMNPEFLREGEAIKDFMEPDRIILGGIDKKTIAVLDELYRGFPNVDKVHSNPRTAEMIKYTSNSLLATLISFSNEIGNLCSLIGVDVVDVMEGVYLDKRFSPILSDGSRVKPASLTYLSAGCGFGGSCFPKDVKALIAYGDQEGHSMALLKSVIQVNEAQPSKMLSLLEKHFSDLSGCRITILGMAFKPGTDDIRESPSLLVTQLLLDAKAIVTCYDPIATEAVQNVFADKVIFGDDLVNSICDADAILLMTRWPQFENLNELVLKLDTNPLIIDGRRFLDKLDFQRYEGIGLGKI